MGCALYMREFRLCNIPTSVDMGIIWTHRRLTAVRPFDFIGNQEFDSFGFLHRQKLTERRSIIKNNAWFHPGSFPYN